MISYVLSLAATVFCVTSLLVGQAVVPADQLQLSFKFERPAPGVPVPRYRMEIHGDGSGFYRAEVTVSKSTETQLVERVLQFAPATVQASRDALQLMRSSQTACEAHIKNIADTGAKTIEYRDTDGKGACSYNYSENKGVVKLTEFFQGIEQTLEAGRALDFKHRYDRLGLDAEMISLAANVDSGRAIALETIVPTLRSIAADTELIERVRLRAAKLLERTTDAR